MITLHVVACLPHLPIIGGLLHDSGYSELRPSSGWWIIWVWTHIWSFECRATNGAHIQFSNPKELYENHLVAAAEGDSVFVEYHRARALRCWFMFLVGTS